MARTVYHDLFDVYLILQDIKFSQVTIYTMTWAERKTQISLRARAILSAPGTLWVAGRTRFGIQTDTQAALLQRLIYVCFERSRYSIGFAVHRLNYLYETTKIVVFT